MHKNVHFWSSTQNLKGILQKSFSLKTIKNSENRFPFEWCYSQKRTTNRFVVVDDKLKADLTTKNFFAIFLLWLGEKNFFGALEQKLWVFRPSFESLFFWFTDCTNESNCFMLMFRTDVFSTFSAWNRFCGIKKYDSESVLYENRRWKLFVQASVPFLPKKRWKMAAKKVS